MITQIRSIATYMISILMFSGIFFLFLRFILRMLGANPASPIVAFVYSIAAIFKLPFYQIFPNLRLLEYENAAIDFVALSAIFGYALIYFFIVYIIYLIARIIGNMFPE